ncbi:hypothetical protein K438DRAFT_1783627 [Mycena galopus ATCC 62051]|nr:hypothetical protein K438DRAFT_1783627 [Mycena galopus ATCC 62051]
MPESRNAWPEFLRDCIAALGCERSAGMEFSRRQMKAVDSRDISGTCRVGPIGSSQLLTARIRNFSQPLRSFEGVHPGCRVRQLKSASDATDLRRLWDPMFPPSMADQDPENAEAKRRHTLSPVMVLAQAPGGLARPVLTCWVGHRIDCFSL